MKTVEKQGTFEGHKKTTIHISKCTGYALEAILEGFTHDVNCRADNFTKYTELDKKIEGCLKIN